MRVLIDGGADPTLTTDDKTTALMAAAGLGHGGDRYERFWSKSLDRLAAYAESKEAEARKKRR